jgi:2,4-dienoyl-CoA reductase-like NADH-dependent reductase (Old Yellow Enzyme family)/thioredoxin reductase
VELSNRLVVPAMVTVYCNEDGTATEKFCAYHEAKARGGWGLIITEDYAVDPKGRGFPNLAGLWNDDQIESHSKFTKRIHDIGGKIFAQIYHAGRQTGKAVIGCQPVAPSPILCPSLQEIPHELTEDEIREIVGEFGDCARRAREAKFDGIEIHGAHGYLIAQFMSLYSNKRVDAYGGNLMNRLRFPLEIISDIRRKAGNDFPMIFRISGDEMVPGGRNIEDTKAISAILEGAGVDALHVSAGVYGTYGITPPAPVPHGWITGFAQEVKKVVDIPVITVGRITDPLLAEAIIAGKKADLVAMGRASLADPELPNKAAAGKFTDINPCIGCMQGCTDMITKYQPATCLVNPTLGKEEEMRIKPADMKKRVFIAGGGPGGMEAAMVAARRGHEVHLFEKTDRLGGQYYTASIPPFKGEIAGFLAWQKKQLADHKVSIHFNTELTEAIVTEQKPDAVIVAIGSTPVFPDLPGIKRENVVLALDVLEGKTDAGKKVVIIGGGTVGSETASHLANHGKKVTIVEMLPELATDASARIRYFLLKELADRKVQIHVNSTVAAILDDGLTIKREGREEKIGPFDTVVLAAGLKPLNDLQSRLEGKVTKMITIGDAVRVRKALDAVKEGYLAGLEI